MSGTDKYIDLKINGRLFPSWVNLNFKKYKLEEALRTGADPCSRKTDSGVELKKELQKYQQFVGQYLDFKSPYRSILLYLGTGVGKTATAINVYNVLYNYTPGWNVFILVKASIKGEWADELKQWLRKDEYEYRYKNIIFINYDSPFADRQFMDSIKNVDSSKKSMYVIDEVHNFIRNVYSNVTSGVGKRASAIYDYIIQDKKENPDTRVVLLSGTPAVNNPFELALLFNMLRPGIFPKSESEFNQLFITTTSYQVLNKNTKNLFQRRIMGLVAHYKGATVDRYASKKIIPVDVEMSDYQEDVYAYFDDIEKKIALKHSGKKGNTVYKVYTRQACNFVFPAISFDVSGEARPRPGKFRLSEKEAIELQEKGEIKDKAKMVNSSKYLQTVKVFITTFDEYLAAAEKADTAANYTIMDDYNNYKTHYDGNFSEFNTKETKKSKLYAAMYVASPKMICIIFNTLKALGPVVVYSNYVLMEGLELFKVYLKYFGFYNVMDTMELQEGVGFVEYHGQVNSMEDRRKGQRMFNNPNNKYGNQIKIMLISPAGAEGLNLRNVRQVHIMEPYWHEVRINQIIGRGIRQCSHEELPMDERHVDIYRYRSVRVKSDRMSTDQYIEDRAKSKDGLIQSFLDAVQEVSVDCHLFKAHNMAAQEYKCFQFDEPSQFDKYIGPAYKEDITDDLKMDNGSNSTKSNTVKIKVMKIKAVQIISSPESENNIKYSKPAEYWYYAKSGVVYDIDLHFPVGKVAADESGIAAKYDNDTYIIDYVVPIPVITD